MTSAQKWISYCRYAYLMDTSWIPGRGWVSAIEYYHTRTLEETQMKISDRLHKGLLAYPLTKTIRAGRKVFDEYISETTIPLFERVDSPYANSVRYLSADVVLWPSLPDNALHEA